MATLKCAALANEQVSDVMPSISFVLSRHLQSDLLAIQHVARPELTKDLALITWFEIAQPRHTFPVAGWQNDELLLWAPDMATRSVD